MYKREHHQRIAKILDSLNVGLFRENHCYFGGGTAIALLLGEYRESVDIDFLVSNLEGYRAMRAATGYERLGDLLSKPLNELRDLRKNRDKITAVVEMDGEPVKIECFIEARIELDPPTEQIHGFGVLTRHDLYAEKLLAISDRGLDASVMSRDIIDLAMMVANWGPIPQIALDKAYRAYGEPSIVRGLEVALKLFEKPDHRRKCLHALQVHNNVLPQLDDGIAQIREFISEKIQ